jgi:hypothetical protein
MNNNIACYNNFVISMKRRGYIEHTKKELLEYIDYCKEELKTEDVQYDPNCTYEYENNILIAEFLIKTKYEEYKQVIISCE